MVARAIDGREHRRIGRRAVLQQLHVVAGGERAAHQGFLHGQVQAEDVGLHAGGLEPVEDGLALRIRKWPTGTVHLHRGIR
ncbi:hypothetical protein D3C78_1741540 [compost metagenome]